MQRYDRPTSFCGKNLEFIEASDKIEKVDCKSCITSLHQLSLTRLYGTAIFKRSPQNFDVDYRTNDPREMEPEEEGQYYATIFRGHPANPLCYNNAISNVERLLEDDFRLLEQWNSIIIQEFR